MKRTRINILSILIFFTSVLHSYAVNWDQDINFLKKELACTPDDTSTINVLNSIAYEFYRHYEYDSCLKYGTKALILSDSLLNSDEVKNYQEYLIDCQVHKALSLANIARGIKTSNTPASIDTLRSALKLIKKHGSKLQEGAIYESIAVIHNFVGQSQLALENNLLALEAYREGEDKGKEASQLTNLAVSYRYMGNYGDALEYLVESLDICREISDSTIMVETLLAIGFTYMYVEKWEEALKAQGEALEIFKKMNDSLGIATVYNDMGITNLSAGNIDLALEQHKNALAIRLNSTDYYYTYASYMYLGRIYRELGSYEKAIEQYGYGLKYAKLAGFKTSLIDVHINKGLSYLQLPDLDKAMEQFMLALQVNSELQNMTSEAEISLYIAKVYLAQDQAQEALNWLEKAENAAPASEYYYLKLIYKNISDTYYKLGDIENAYSNLIMYNQVKDSLAVIENLDKLTTLTNKLEYENKKRLQDESHQKMMEIKQSEIKRQKVVRNFILFGALVILILGYHH